MRTKQPEDDGSDEDLEGIDEEEEEKEIEEITRGDVPEEQNWAGVDDPDMGAKGMGFSQDQKYAPNFHVRLLTMPAPCGI